MDVPSYLEPQLDVLISRADEESAVQPKFMFALGAEQVGDLTPTKKLLHIMRWCIEEEVCPCVQETSKKSKELWNLLDRISHTSFLTPDPPPPPAPFPTDEIDASNVPLWFDVLGLLLLNLNVNDSFLHINSGTGYACTVAAWLIGRNSVNRGVEFREAQRQLAKLNAERLRRSHAGDGAAYSLPLYLAHFPADLLDWRSKFDRILVTDCFEDLRDVLPLKYLLKPDGLLVTSFVRVVDNEREVGMVRVNRYELTDEEIKIDEIDEYAYDGPSYELHLVGEESFCHCFLHFRDARMDTIARLREARRSSESPVPSLQTLALRMCCKLSDPIGRLRGSPPSPFLLRISSRDEHLPNLTTQLGHMTAAFQSFRMQCALAFEDGDSPARLRSMKEELACLVVAFDALGKKFIGRQTYASWKNGESVRLPMQQGVMVWLLENTFHIFQHSGDSCQCASITVNSTFESYQSHCYFSTDEASTVTLMSPLLKAFLNFFRSVDFQISDEQAPWNYQLSSAQQMRRLLTRLAARFWADASCMMTIVKTMKAHCDAAHEGPSWLNTALNSNLEDTQSFLTQLSDQALTQSERFAGMELFLETFSALTAHVARMHHDACFLLAAGWGIPEVRSLFHCFRFACSSALRNLVGSGRLQGSQNPVEQLQFVNGEGNLMDPALFQEERSFLLGDGFQDFIHSEDVSNFLVRRFMSDLKEALWMANSVSREKQLMVLEKNVNLYHLVVLEPHFSIPYILGVLRSLW